MCDVRRSNITHRMSVLHVNPQIRSTWLNGVQNEMLYAFRPAERAFRKKGKGGIRDAYSL